MRTIKVELSSPLPGAPLFGTAATISISTEAIVGDDTEAAQAGNDAREVIDAFIVGYSGDTE